MVFGLLFCLWNGRSMPSIGDLSQDLILEKKIKTFFFSLKTFKDFHLLSGNIFSLNRRTFKNPFPRQGIPYSLGLCLEKIRYRSTFYAEDRYRGFSLKDTLNLASLCSKRPIRRILKRILHLEDIFKQFHQCRELLPHIFSLNEFSKIFVECKSFLISKSPLSK